MSQLGNETDVRPVTISWMKARGFRRRARPSFAAAPPGSGLDPRCTPRSCTRTSLRTYASGGAVPGYESKLPHPASTLRPHHNQPQEAIKTRTDGIVRNVMQVALSMLRQCGAVRVTR